jgi:hypothetical protein
MPLLDATDGCAGVGCSENLRHCPMSMLHYFVYFAYVAFSSVQNKFTSHDNTMRPHVDGGVRGHSA